jgi:hypothetical protein
MKKIKITTKGGAYLKPMPLQYAVLQQNPQLSAKLELLPEGREYELLYYHEKDGHYYVVLANDAPGVRCDRGYIFNGSATITDDAPKAWDIGGDFAGRVVSYMLSKGYALADGQGDRNIVYLEGVDLDGKENDDKFNGWNDLSAIISFKGSRPYFAYKSVCTTEPGDRYTYNPMNEGGAARIAFGQYKAAWVVGLHGRDNQHALIQTGNVKVHRDKNMDGSRAGDALDVGSNFGINQHGPYTGPLVGVSSAGCLVRSLMSEHRRFMDILTSFENGDRRYQRDTRFRFDTTVLDGSDFARSQWGYG